MFDRERFSLRRLHGTQIDVTFKPKYRSRTHFLKEYKESFLQYTATLDSVIKSWGKSIVCDVSGGFDTRTVFGGFQAAHVKAHYVTNNVLGNESAYASALLKAFGISNLSVVDYNDTQADKQSDEELTFITDCTASALSTRICLDALQPIHKKYAKDFVRVGGIDFTDFIRKGYRDDGGDLGQSIVSGTFNGISADVACSIAGSDKEEYIEYLTAIFSDWPETTNGDRYKKLFFRRTLVMQSRLPDDRERLDIWTIHPMWNHKLCLDVLQHFPLRWRGNYLHTLLLRAIDKRLIQVPVDKTYVDFTKLFKMYTVDARDNSSAYKRFREMIFYLMGRPKPGQRSVLDRAYIETVDTYIKQLRQMAVC